MESSSSLSNTHNSASQSAYMHPPPSSPTLPPPSSPPTDPLSASDDIIPPSDPAYIQLSSSSSSVSLSVTNRDTGPARSHNDADADVFDLIPQPAPSRPRRNVKSTAASKKPIASRPPPSRKNRSVKDAENDNVFAIPDSEPVGSAKPAVNRKSKRKKQKEEEQEVEEIEAVDEKRAGKQVKKKGKKKAALVSTEKEPDVQHVGEEEKAELEAEEVRKAKRKSKEKKKPMVATDDETPKRPTRQRKQTLATLIEADEDVVVVTPKKRTLEPAASVKDTSTTSSRKRERVPDEDEEVQIQPKRSKNKPTSGDEFPFIWISVDIDGHETTNRMPDSVPTVCGDNGYECDLCTYYHRFSDGTSLLYNLKFGADGMFMDDGVFGRNRKHAGKQMLDAFEMQDDPVVAKEKAERRQLMDKKAAKQPLNEFRADRGFLLDKDGEWVDVNGERYGMEEDWTVYEQANVLRLPAAPSDNETD